MNDYIKNNWGEVYLQTFNGGDNQRWEMEGDNLISNYRQLRLGVNGSNDKDGAAVGSYVQNRNPNQRWTFGTIRAYFFILNKKTGKVLDATSDSEIKQWNYQNSENQLWFWEGKCIRNKRYVNRVMDFHLGGRLFLTQFKGTKSQEWKYDDKDKSLVSTYYNLTLEVQNESSLNGAVIKVKSRRTQKWNLVPEHDFFTITSRQDTKVLDADEKSRSGRVVMWTFHGGNNQLWFWDGDNIRSKVFPRKVLTLYMTYYNRRKVYLSYYNGGDNQRWRVDGDQIISGYTNLRLGIRHGSTRDGAEVGGYINNGNLNQMWSINAKERIYFSAKGVGSGKALDAYAHTDGVIGLWSLHGGDNQLWYWDNDSIRSKEHPSKVISLDISNDNVYLQRYYGGQNQKWEIEGKNIICKYRQLFLQVSKRFGKELIVGGLPGYPADNHRWIISATRPTCVSQTEKNIYNVVKWIPVVSTVWNFFSAIGYAISGCTSVAAQRTISLAIGSVTGGAASGLSSLLLTSGVNAAITFGLGKGMNTIVKIPAQQSIKNPVERKEIIVDLATFLTNAGKINNNVLTNPVMTFEQSLKEASQKFDDLKQLKAKYELRQRDKSPMNGTSSDSKDRCNEGGFVCCLRIENGYSEDQQRLYRELLDSNALSKNVDTCANRYMALEGRGYDHAPQHIKDKIGEVSTNIKKAELFALYKYTENSDDVNTYLQTILDDKPLIGNTTFFLDKSVDQIFSQATLVQSYLKKQPLQNPKTLYRFERQYTDNLYENGTVYTSHRFMFATGKDSTSKSGYPIKLTIHLLNSGVNISDFSKCPDKWLIPIGTKFRVAKEIVVVESYTIIRVTLTEI